MCDEVIQQLGRMAPAINTAVVGFLPTTASVAAGGAGIRGAAGAIASSSFGQGVTIAVQAIGIMRSGGMRQLEEAARSGTSAAVQIGGRTITYDPGPFSGMTNFAGNSFHLGREAFASRAELTKTVLHELFRLRNGAGSSASGASAIAETRAAASFAERAYRSGSRLGIW